ncbi:MAG: DUF3987 domain-containing protein [Bacteroidales bacterium]|nr:DUF3987 domain-containing protein [Bacteroidales bacterium]
MESILQEFDNSFPVAAFPDQIQWIIKATNESLKFPIDFVGCSMLFASAIAIGNTHRVKVMNNWTEGATLYIALVGRSGTNKTHPLKFGIEPILKKDSETHKEYCKAKAEYQGILNRAKVDGVEELPAKPFWKRIIISDFTPEALSEIHRFNLRGLGVYADELNQWVKNFNRYSTGSATEFWLSNFSGTPITIDRKNQDPILITKPSISVCGSIQPGILQELQRDNRAQNGFIDRILFALPETLQKHYWSENELSDSLTAYWNQVVNKLLNMPLRTDKSGDILPTTLEFSETAKDVLKAWQKRNTDIINDTYSDTLAGIYSKLEIYCIRFALIFELLQQATGVNEKENYAELDIQVLFRKASFKCHPDTSNLSNGAEIFNELKTAYEAGDKNKVIEIYENLHPQKIGVSATESAIQLTEYFRKTARRVNAILNNTPIEGLDQRKREIYLKLPDEFKTDTALRIAEQFEYSERSLKYFLNDRTFFDRIEHGKYKKKY